VSSVFVVRTMAVMETVYYGVVITLGYTLLCLYKLEQLVKPTITDDFAARREHIQN
jgi:hypothetical protein